MEAPAALEFLLVSNNHKTLAAVAEGLEQIGIKFNFAPTSEAGRDYVGRRKVDGIIVDLDVPGAHELISSIRHGNSNPSAAVFACLPRSDGPSVAVVPGATALLPHPLTAETVASLVSAARASMLGERRRYFRYPVDLPIRLVGGGGEQRGKMTSLSEGGMAVYTMSSIGRTQAIQFEFKLPCGDLVAGRGTVVWANGEGMIGAKFIFLRGEGEECLQRWLQQQPPSALEA